MLLVPSLPPVGVSVEAEVTNCDLTLFGNKSMSGGPSGRVSSAAGG